MKRTLSRSRMTACALAICCWLAPAAHAAVADGSLARLPGTWMQPWQDAEKRAATTRMALDTAMKSEREAVEAQVFGRIANALGLSTLDGITVDYFRHRVSLKVSLQDYIRLGRVYEYEESSHEARRQYERGMAVVAPDGRSISGPAARRVLKVLQSHDAASLVQAAVATRLDAAGAPHRALIADAALAELHFAQLEAVRRGDISTEQHIRLASAIANDRGDSDGDLAWAVHTARIGTTWFHGDEEAPLRLPVFTLRVRAAHAQPAMQFLYVPGHPAGSLRYFPESARLSSLVTDGGKFPTSILTWLDTRMPRPHFLKLLAETKQQVRNEPLEVSLPAIPSSGRPIRFKDAVVAMHVEKARSSMDPHFMGKLDPVTWTKALRIWTSIHERASQTPPR